MISVTFAPHAKHMADVYFFAALSMVVFFFQQVVHVKLMYDKESNRMRGKHVKNNIVLCLFFVFLTLAYASSFYFLF